MFPLFKMKYKYLYKITNLINGMIYVGIHRTNNLEDGYMGSSLILKKLIKKHGINNFKKEIIKFVKTEKQLFLEEAKIVNESFVKRKDTYNRICGGNGSWLHTKGKTKVYDENGKIILISTKDERFLNGELLSIFKNKVCTKDKNGNFKFVSKDDFNYLNGNLVHISKGKSVVKDYNGKIFQVDKNDSRIGKTLFGVWKGRHHTTESKNKISLTKKGTGVGSLNSQFGTMWITNGKENRKIKKENKIPKGFRKGMINFKRTLN